MTTVGQGVSRRRIVDSAANPGMQCRCRNCAGGGEPGEGSPPTRTRRRPARQVAGPPARVWDLGIARLELSCRRDLGIVAGDVDEPKGSFESRSHDSVSS